MKHTLMTLSLLLAVMASEAAPITTEKAEENALAFLTSGNIHRVKGYRNLKLAYTCNDDKSVGTPLFHVFNIGDGNGFVIASADDVAVPVLGYCDSGGFDPDDLPENMREWLDGYARQISQINEKPDAFSRSGLSTNTTANKKNIDAMIVTHWGQADPYNDQCVFDGHRCLTGCVATAMAQVLYYWATTGKDGVTFRPGCTALEGYASSYHVPALDALESFEWDVMHPLKEINIYSVAQLMRYCGQSLKMRYGINESITSGHYLPMALHKHFGYNFTMDDVFADSYTTADWVNLIYNELSKGRPVVMQGGSHCFVCDGYDAASGQFHFNWGWNGGADGWFAMTALNPGNYHFNSDLFAIININPLANNEPFPYAILSEDKASLSFYHDSQYKTRDGILCRIQGDIPDWQRFGHEDDDNPITEVVFTPSFASARPQYTSSWFDLENLSSITGIQYLNTERVTDMNSMFMNSYLYEIDVSHFDTSKVKDMFKMFESCPVEYLDVSNWNTSNIIDTHDMFYNSGLREIDMSNWDASNITNCDHMFYDCWNLKNVVLPSNLPMIGVGMFSNCERLKYISLPSTITKVGDWAFSGYGSCLSHVIVRFDKPLDITANTFPNRHNATLYVPIGTSSLFRSAEYWKDFKNIKEWKGDVAGDVNFDDKLNMTDIACVIDFILGSEPPLFYRPKADVNKDGAVNISDVTRMVNIIIK